MNGLWFKLHKLGVRGRLLRLVRDVYSKIRAKVRDCSSYIDFFECSVGLKQSEVLSPILFSLFFEDLEMYLFDNENSGLTLDKISFIIMLFADDMVFFGKDVTCMELQNSLDFVYDYCQTWGLTVNPDKSKKNFINVDLYSNQRSGYIIVYL